MSASIRTRYPSMELPIARATSHTDAVDRVALCARQDRCPAYTADTITAAREAIEARRGMVNDIGPAGYEWAWERS